MAKKISDKERLNWLDQDGGASISPDMYQWIVHDDEGKTIKTCRNIRQAIDEGMKAERGRK